MLRKITSSLVIMLLIVSFADCVVADCGKCGLKVGNGLSKLTDAQQAGAEAAGQAKKALGDAVPKVVLVYDNLKNDVGEKEKLIEGVASVFDKALIYGCTSYSPLTQQSNEGTVGVLAMAGDVAVNTAVADLHDGYQPCGVKIGAYLQQQGVPDSKGKVLLLFGDCHVDKNDALVAGVKSILGEKFPIVGGASRGDFLYYKGKIVRKSNLGLLLSGNFKCGFSTKKDNSPEGLITSARQACSEAVAGKKDDVVMTFAFDCGGRRDKMKDNLPKELAAMKEILGESPIFGFYGSGEIGP
ncbi:MAG: FIST N-terminal domain-containing protein, partial [Planctomycetota bacterium]